MLAQSPRPSRSRLSRVCGGSVLAVLVTVAGCTISPLQRPPDECLQSFQVPLAVTDRCLEIRIPSGRVTIADGAQPACDVMTQVRAASPAEAQRLAAGVDLVVETQGGVRVVSVQTPDAIDIDAINLCVAVTAPPA